MPQQTFLFKQRGIQFYISLFSSFLSFSNAFPSDLQSIKDAILFRPQSLHHCPVRRRQLVRRGHKAVLRPSSRGIDAQLSSLWGWPDIQPSSPLLQLVSSSPWSWPDMQSSSSLQLVSSSLWSWPDMQLPSPLQLVSSSLWGWSAIQLSSPCSWSTPLFSWSTSQFYPLFGNRSALLAT